MNPGETIADRYIVEALAGSGAMGSVFRALDTRTGEKVALKVLRAREHTERFAREARILEALADPAIVHYVGRGHREDGAPYLVTTWIDGEDLASRLRRGPLAIEEVLCLGERIAGALATAHDAGVVHRDVKPGNILLPGGDIGSAMLSDFGVARWDAGITHATGTGVLIGTPSYMAPEQARGSQPVDARVDVYALGCVLFECITGHTPFTGDHALAVLAKVLFEEAKSPISLRVGVPLALDRLVMRMISKEPDNRPADGAAAGREIKNARMSEMAAQNAPSGDIASGELRLYSVLLAAPAKADPRGALSGTLAEPGREPSFVRLALASGGRFEVLVDGTVLIVFSSAPTATDLALCAARCAASLSGEAPESIIVLATGRGDASQAWPVGEAIDLAVEMLQNALKEQDRAPGIRADETTAALLDGLFDSTRASFAALARGHIG